MNESLIRSIKPAPILVAGDVMVDEYVLGQVDRISPESPVPVLTVRDRLRRLGGAGNVAKNLVSMGGGVALFATVGGDAPGNWLKRHCEEMAVEGFWLRVTASRPTTVKTRVVAKNQQIVRIDDEQVLEIPPEMEKAVVDDIKSVVPQVKAVIVSDYGKGFLTRGVLKALIGSAGANKVPVLVDPKGMDYSRYRGATYITPNIREASVAAGIQIHDRESLIRAGHVILDQAEAEGLIVTRGKEGSTLVTREDTTDFPVKPVEIIDVTGAGDTVIATLAMCLANALSIENSIAIANLAASLVVSRFGASAVTLKEMADSLDGRVPESKLVGIEEIASVLRAHRLQGETIVFTNGCFDLFHPGHLKILRQASSQGRVLVVGLNSDESIGRIKGPGRPIISQEDRVELISALGFVDYVVVFEEDTPQRLIEQVRPDVLVKGEDWEGKVLVGEDVVRARGGKVGFVKHVEGISTTDLITKIKQNL